MRVNKHLACALAALGAVSAGDAALTGAAAQQGDCLIGETRYFAGNFAPRGWAFAEGQLLPIASNTALFSIIGTTFGGDGRTTFALPDLSGRTAIHAGRGPGMQDRVQGQRVGTETVTLTMSTLGAHTHSAATTTTLKASSAAGDNASPAGRVLANDGSDRIYSALAPDSDMHAGSAVSTTTVAAAGSASPAAFSNVQPSLGLSPIVCLVGIYPPRP